MTEILYLLILMGCGVAISQDAIASFCFYDGREGRKNQAFRVCRLGIGILIIVTTLRLATGV